MKSTERQLVGKSKPPIRSVHLVAPESRRRAFYKIWIEESGSGFRVCKESGASGRVWDRRAWELHSVEDAFRLLDRRIREKTSPHKKRARTYQEVPA